MINMHSSNKIFFVALILFLILPISQIYNVNDVKTKNLEQITSNNRNTIDPILNLHTNLAKIQNLVKNKYANRAITNIRSTNQPLTTISENYTAGFISTWNTNESGVSNDTQITLPLLSTGTYNFTVAWGDGQINTIATFNSVNATHTYASSGIYTVNITGELLGWSFNRGGDAQKLLGISHWGNLRLGNTGDYFANATNLVLTATDPLNLNGTTTLSGAFEYCYNLGSHGNMDSWNTSGITDMSYMFAEDYTFNQGIDRWDVSHVTDFQNMFNVDYMVSIKSHTPSFNQYLGAWNVSSAKNMSRMFQGERYYNQPLNNWNVSQVTNMTLMFTDCAYFNQPLNNWDVSHVQDMSYMFAASLSFNQPLNNWNVSNVIDMKVMFLYAESFNQPLNNWNTSRVTNFKMMFDTDAVFYQNLDSWNVSSAKNMYAMFANDFTLNNPLNSWDVSQVTNMSHMFEKDQSFNQNLDSWNVSNVKDMSYMFYETNPFNQPLNDWNLAHVQNLKYMFYDDYKFNQPLNDWNVMNVRNMSYMFGYTSSFNQSLDKWNVSKVTDMTGMFNDSTSFNQNLGSWNVSNVQFMDNMFQNVNLSVSNYDHLLNGWSKLHLRYNVSFDAGHSKYDSSAVGSRKYIIQTFNWTIYDGGFVSSKSSPSILQFFKTNSLGLIVLVLLVAIISAGFVLFIKMDLTGPEASNKRNLREYLKNKLHKKSENHKERISEETFEMMETIIEENEGK